MMQLQGLQIVGCCKAVFSHKKWVLSENCYKLFMLLLQQASKITPEVIHNPHQRYFLRSSYLINNVFCTLFDQFAYPYINIEKGTMLLQKVAKQLSAIFFATYNSWFIKQNKMKQQEHWLLINRYCGFLNVFQRQMLSQCLAQYCREQHRAKGQKIFILSGHGVPVWDSHCILPALLKMKGSVGKQILWLTFTHRYLHVKWVIMIIWWDFSYIMAQRHS